MTSPKFTGHDISLLIVMGHIETDFIAIEWPTMMRAYFLYALAAPTSLTWHFMPLILARRVKLGNGIDDATNTPLGSSGNHS